MATTTRIALVTGANKGIGKAIARGLAQQGMTVLLGARDQERGELAAAELQEAGTVLFQQLDVTDIASLQAAAQAINERFGKLDVLINNAGSAGGGAVRQKPSETTAAELREVYETNVFAVVTVIHEMLPLLRQAPAARIVNISSLRGSLGDAGAFVGQPAMPYSTSKTALNAITVHYARELANTSIKINAGAPGFVATDLNNFAGVRTPEQGAVVAIQLAMLAADGPTGGFFDDKGPIVW